MKVIITQERTFDENCISVFKVVSTYYPVTSDDCDFINDLSSKIMSGIVTEQKVGEIYEPE